MTAYIKMDTLQTPNMSNGDYDEKVYDRSTLYAEVWAEPMKMGLNGEKMAGCTRLELATYGVTGQRSNQLS